MTKIINGIEIPEKTVYGNLVDRNKDNMNIPAIEYYGNQLTFDEFLNKEILYYVNAFKKLGLKKGDVVTLCMPGVPEFIIAYYALNAMGAVANGVSIAFLKNNLKRYTDEKNSETLIIFDKFYDLIKDQIEGTKIKNVVFSSISGYMPEELKEKFKNDNILDNATKSNIILPGDKEFIKMEDFINSGKIDIDKLKLEEYDENRDSTYLYSSGTTADPKCVVFRDYAINALVSMHDKVKLNEDIGDRSLLIIPPYYATSLLYAINLQLSKGKTLVLQPIYDKYTFAKDLKTLNINHTVAAMSHYAAAIKDKSLQKGDLKGLKFPGCGGEGVPYALAKQINEALEHFGAQERLVIGGGTSELGSSTFAAYNIPNRVNETGIALPGVKVKIVDPDTKKEVRDGERGEIVISSPNSMHRYYDNEQATNEYFTIDDDGYRWGWPGDIAVHNQNGSYTMLGRKSNSYINSENKRSYLFDTKEILSSDPAIYECEAIALPTESGNKNVEVVFVVLNEDYEGTKTDVIKRITKKCKVDGVKFIDAFGTSEITGKRDTKALLKDRENYYLPYNDEKSIKIDFPVDSEPKIEYIDNDSINQKGKMKKLV